MLCMEWTVIFACKRLLDRAPVCRDFTLQLLYMSPLWSILFFIGSGYSCLIVFLPLLSVCLSVCLCGGVCAAGLFAMVLCRMAIQRLTGRGRGVIRRHSLCSRNRLRRSGWTHHRKILVYPDLSSTRIMNILYNHSALQ